MTWCDLEMGMMLWNIEYLLVNVDLFARGLALPQYANTR